MKNGLDAVRQRKRPRNLAAPGPSGRFVGQLLGLIALGAYAAVIVAAELAHARVGGTCPGGPVAIAHVVSLTFSRGDSAVHMRHAIDLKWPSHALNGQGSLSPV